MWFKKNKKIICPSGLDKESTYARIIDNYSKFDMAVSKQKKKKCEKECCDCCYTAFFIGDNELFVALDYFENQGYSFEELYKKTQLIENNFILQDLIDEADTEEFTLDKMTQFIDEHPEFEQIDVIKCPFLIKNKCSIYPVRPAVCRYYGTGIVCQKQVGDNNLKNLMSIMAMNEFIMGKESRAINFIERKFYPIFHRINMLYENQDVIIETNTLRKKFKTCSEREYFELYSHINQIAAEHIVML